jgi:hypothetical protein
LIFVTPQRRQDQLVTCASWSYSECQSCRPNRHLNGRITVPPVRTMLKVRSTTQPPDAQDLCWSHWSRRRAGDGPVPAGSWRPPKHGPTGPLRVPSPQPRSHEPTGPYFYPYNPAALSVNVGAWVNVGHGFGRPIWGAEVPPVQSGAGGNRYCRRFAVPSGPHPSRYVGRDYCEPSLAERSDRSGS